MPSPGPGPDWGSPPGPPRLPNPPSIGGPERVQSGRSRSRIALFVTAGLAALGMVAVGAFLLLNDDEGGGDETGTEAAAEEGSPEDTAQTLFAAAKDGDCETAVSVATENFFAVPSRAEALSACQGFVDSNAPGWVDDYTVEDVQIRDEQATTARVAVILNPGPGSEAPPGWILGLVKGDDDQWLVDEAEIATSEDDASDDPGGGVGPAGANQPTPPPTGAEESMDDLAQSCFEGDMVGCDQLFDVTFDPDLPDQSEYPEHAEYGYSCGGRFEGEIEEACQDLIPEPPAA